MKVMILFRKWCDQVLSAGHSTFVLASGAQGQRFRAHHFDSSGAQHADYSIADGSETIGSAHATRQVGAACRQCCRWLWRTMRVPRQTGV